MAKSLRYLDNLEAGLNAAIQRDIDVYDQEKQRQAELMQAYREAVKKNPELVLPAMTETGPDFSEISRKLLNDLANNNNFKDETEALAAIDNDPLLSRIHTTPEAKRAAASAIFTRSNEKYSSHKTWSELLDEDPRDLVDRSYNEEGSDSFLGNFAEGAWETTKDLLSMPFEMFGATDRAKNHNAQADLARQMSAFDKSTQTGMQKYYTLQDLTKRKEELEKNAAYTAFGESTQRELEFINSKIQAITGSLSQAELEAINKNGKQYDDLKNQRDSLIALDPDKYAKRTSNDVLNDLERARLEYNQLFRTGNADIFNLDNLAYDWEIAKSYLTKDQLGYFAGMMVPWAIGAEYTGSIKVLNAATSGAMKAIMGMGKTPAGRNAIAHAFSEIGKGISTGAAAGLKEMATPMGAVMFGSAASSYAGAYSKSSTDFLNDYFNREGTVNGFNEIEAGLYGMAEHFANFYGGHLAGKAIPTETAKKALNKLLGDEIRSSMTAARSAIGMGNEGALADAAITKVLSKMANPSAMLQALGEAAGRKAEAIATRKSLAGKTGMNLASTELKVAEGMLKGASWALSNASGLSIAGGSKAGMSLATDNFFASIAHQKGQQKGEIDWNEVGKSAIEGLIAGAAGHPSSTGVGYARAALKRAANKSNGYFDSQEVRDKKIELLNSNEYKGTADAIHILQSDIQTLNKSVNKLSKEKAEIKAELSKPEYAQYIESDGTNGLIYKEPTGSLTAEEKAKAKYAKKQVKEYNLKNDLEAEASRRLIADKDMRIEQVKAYRDKNVDANFTEDALLSSLLDKAPESEGKSRDYDEESFKEVIRRYDEAMTDAQVKREHEALKDAKVHTAEEIFGTRNVSTLTKEANETDEEFAARQKEDSDRLKTKALSVARAMGQAGRDLDDLSDEEIRQLADKKWDALNRSLTDRMNAIDVKSIKAKKPEDRTEDDINKLKEYNRLGRLRARYTKEKFDKNRASIATQNLNTDTLETHGYLPTKENVEEGANTQFKEGDSDYVTLDDLKNAYNAGKDSKDLREDLTKKLEKSSKNQDEKNAVLDNAEALYNEFNNQIDANVAAHNARVSAGTRTRTVSHAELKKNNPSMTEKEITDEAEKQVKQAIEDEIAKLKLSEDYEASTVTYHKDGEKITEGFVQRKKGTTLDEKKRVLDSVSNALNNNNTLLTDQLKQTGKAEADKLAADKKLVLTNLLENDKSARKTLNKFGYNDIKTLDDLSKQSLPVQQKVTRLLAESADIAVSAKEKRIKNIISNAPKGSVFEHYMTGHKDVSLALAEARHTREQRHQLLDLIDMAEMQKDREDKLGVTFIKGINLDSSKNDDLIKFIYHQLYYLDGFMDNNLQDSVASIVEDDIVNHKNNTEAKKQALIKWATGLKITERGKQQLNWLVQYLRSNLAKYQDDTNLNQLIPFLSRLNTLINNYAVVDSTGRDFINSAAYTDLFTIDKHKERVNNMLNTLNNITAVFNSMGLAPTTESQYAQLYDWHIDDMLLKLDEATSLSREAKQYLLGSMSEDMIRLPSILRNITSLPEWNKICEFLADTVNRQGNTQSFLAIDTIIEAAKADRSTSNETVKFFETLKEMDDAERIRKAFESLSKKEMNWHIKDEAIALLLKQIPVLGILGLLEEKSDAASELNPYKRYDTGLAFVTDSTKKLDSFIQKLHDISSKIIRGKNQQSNDKKQAILEFALLSNINNINGMSNAFIQNEFTRRLLDYTFSMFGINKTNFDPVNSSNFYKNILKVNLSDEDFLNLLQPVLSTLIQDQRLYSTSVDLDIKVLPKRSEIKDAILKNINKDSRYSYNTNEAREAEANKFTDIICSKYGKLVGLAQAIKTYQALYDANGKLKDSAKNISKHFRDMSKAIEFINLTIPSYNDFTEIDSRTFNKESLPEFLHILEANNTTSKAIEDFLKREAYSDSERSWIMNALFTAEGVDKNLPLSLKKFDTLNIDEDKLNTLAKILGDYINRNTIPNTYTLNNSGDSAENITERIKGITRRFHNDKQKDYISQVHKHNRHKLPDANAFKADDKYKSCLMASDQGIQEFLNEFAGTVVGTNASYLVEQIMDVAQKLSINLKVDNTGKRIIDSVETVNGEFNPYYLRVVATVALANLPNLSSDMTDDYYATLVDRYGQNAARAMRDQNLADMDVAVKSIGESIVRALGYNVNSPFFADAAIEAGQHALVALQLAKYIKNIHISKENGLPVGDDVRGEGLVNTVRAIQIMPSGKSMGPNLQARAIYHDASGSHSLLDQFAGRDTQNDTAPLTEEQRKKKQELLRAEFESDTTLPSNANVTKGHVVYNSDRDMVAVCLGVDTSGSKPKHNWYFMRGKEILKTDDVNVSDERLYQLALKSKQPKWCDRVMTWTFFKDFFNDDGSLRWTEADAERIQDIVEQYPAVKQLIEYHKSEKNYGDTSELGGQYDINMTTKDKENFRKMVKNARYLKELFKNDLTKANIQKEQGFGTGSLALYYDEINTVNNRAFVSSVLFNYREYSPFRHLFTMNKEEDCNIDTGTTSVADRIYPILFSLGFKHDKLDPGDGPNKLSDDEMVSKVWHQFIGMTDGKGNSLFVDLLNTVEQNTSNIGAILDAIKDFNTKVAALKSGNTYDIVSPALDGGKHDSKVFKIADNMEAVTALINLLKIKYNIKGASALAQTVATSTRLDQLGYLAAPPSGKASIDNIILTNYRLRVEIDGLTNGPSIKEIADSMHLRGTAFTKLVVNGVGLSLSQASIMGNQLDLGTLDTYLLNSSVAQYDLNLKEAQNMIINNYRDSDVLNYFKDLYTLTEGNESLALTEIMANILSRDMMKKPVMVVGYEAGMKSVLLKMAMQFDLQAARMLWRGNDTHIRNWLNRAIALNGGQPLTVRFQNENGTYETTYLNADGTLKNGTSILGKEAEQLRRKLIFDTNDQPVLKQNLDNVLQNLYTSMTKVMKQPQTPFDMNNEVSEALAETINSILGQYVQNYFKKHEDGIDTMEYRSFIYQASNDLSKKLCTIFNVGNQKLETIKYSVNKSISSYIVSMTCTKDDKIFLKTVYKQANFEALGAGEVPMVIHSFDSEIVHAVQQSLTEKYAREILAVHDAIIVTPTEISTGSPLMNKAYFDMGHVSKGTFVSRDVNLLKAINNIEIMPDLNPELKNAMLRRLKYLYAQTSAYTISLIQDQINFYVDELNKDRPLRQIYNQYALGSITAFQPDDGDLKDGIKILNSYLDEYTKSKYYVNTAVDKAPEVIKKLLNDAAIAGKLTNNKLNAIYNTLIDSNSGKLKFSANRFRQVSDVDELITAIHNVINGEGGITKGTIHSALYKALNNQVNQNPYVNMLRNLHKYYYDTYDSQNNLAARMAPEFDYSQFYNDSSLNGDTAIDTISQILVMAESLTKYHGDDLREVRTRIQNALIEVMRHKSGSANNALTTYDKLLILRKAVGSLNHSQSRAFDDVWGIIGRSTTLDVVDPKNVTLSEYDASQELTLDYSTDLDYEAIARQFSTTFNRELIKNSNQRERSQIAFTWFKKNVIEPVEKQYSGYEGQVGFTLNSHMDLLRFRALSYLKNKNPAAFSKVKIVIIPNTSNLVKETPHISNRALAQYLYIKRENTNKVKVVFNHAPGADNELLSVLIDKGVTEAEIVQKIKISDKESTRIYVPTTGFSNDTFEKRADFAAADYTVNKLNELGAKRAEPITKAPDGSMVGELDPYMLRTTGIRGELKNKYNYEAVAAMDDATVATEIADKNKYQIIRPATDGLIVEPDQLLSAAIEPDNAIVIPVTSNGDIVDNVPYAFTKNVDMFSQAMASFQADRMEDLARYNRNEITWEEYIRPRIVSIDIGSGTPKKFVFQVTQDISFTRGELNNTIEYETYRGKTFPKEVIRDTVFSNMLNTKYQTNPELTNAFTRKYASDVELLSKKRVPIPIHMLNTSKMTGISSNELNSRNAAYMAEVQKTLAESGIKKLYFMQNKIDYYPYAPIDANITLQYMDMAGMNTNNMNAVQSQINTSIKGKVLNMATAAIDWLSAHGSKFKARKIDNTPPAPANTTTHKYTGHGGQVGQDFNAIPDIVKSVLTDGRDVSSVISGLMAEDNANGIDTSYLAGLANSLTGLTTNVVLFVDKANTSVKNSMERFVQEPSRTREEIYLAWGRPTESRTEAFLHELCHTIFNHLSKDSTAYKQAMDLFNYVQKNFTIDAFEDGDTIANRQIMDAIFSEKTQDNLAEFLVYAMTNSKFQKAISSMTIPAKVKEALNKRTTGIFNRFVNMINSWINGTSKDMEAGTYLFPMIIDLFNKATALSNSYWNETNKLNEFIAQNKPLSEELKSGKDNSLLAKALAQIPGKFPDAIRQIINNTTQNDFRNIPSISDSIDGELTYSINSSVDEEDDVLPYIINSARGFNTNLQEGFINDLLSTLEGASKSQMPYLEMRMKGKHAIDWFRNEAATAVNTRVKEILKDYPSKYEAKLVDCFVKADVSCLFNSAMSETEVSELLTNTETRTKKIAELETQIRREKFGNFYVNASKGLAQYIITGFNPTGLAYRNAYEIVAMSGSSNQQITDINGPVTRAVDQLTTLYAVNDLVKNNSEVYNALKPKTLKELSLIHNGIKKAEISQVYRDSAQKYHVPKGQVHGGKIHGRYDIIPESNLKAYEWNGYQKLHDAKLDPFYRGVAERSNTKYVIVSAPNKNPVPTVAGCTVMTDIFKGRSKSGLSFNHENDLDKDIDFRTTADWQRLKNYVNSRVEALNKPNPQLLQNETDGNLVLNFNYLGEMNGANFELNPVKTQQYTEHEIKISSVFGDLFGSVQERTQVPEFNRKIGEACIEIYENSNQKEDFVFISDKSENQDYRDFYDALPFDVKQVVEENYRYKNQGLPVRKKSLNTFFGYRHMSSNDTKQLLKDIEDQKLNLEHLTSGFSNAIRGIFYNKWVGKAEQFFKYLASVGKENIVIKGIATSWYNIVSNYITLNVYGMSPKESVGYQVEAFKQIKILDDINHDLENLHIKRITGTYTTADALQEKNLLNTAKALPIYPLVEAGIVANTLAEDLTETDRLVKDTIDKVIPKGMVNTLAHNAFLTPKAWLYKILSDFASLGDSTGKYAIYKHLTKKGVTPKEAMRQAVNTFIDYSNPIPKEIQYADDLGVLPFIKFALGTQTNIINALTKHPDRSLGWLFANSALGTPVPDIFQSLIGLDTVTNRFQVPGGLFLDSISQLPSVRITNTLGINPF